MGLKKNLELFDNDDKFEIYWSIDEENNWVRKIK